MRSRFGAALLGAALSLSHVEAFSDNQYCKFESMRATTPTSRFTDNLDGTVTDGVTGLQWKRCAEGRVWDGITCRGNDAVFTWQEALKYAAGAVFVNKNDWRLPNVKELSSIVERACYSPAINLEVFPDVYATAAYWTSTPEVYIGAGYGRALVVDFAYGDVDDSFRAGYPTALQPVLLVRNAGGSVAPERRLDDTGIDWWVNADTNNLPAPQADFPGQDADWGRDVTAGDDTDGHAGFSFTKLDAVGNPLPGSAASWACVRDNVTGLIWEHKTSGYEDLRSENWRYLWYEPDPTTNGGDAGLADPDDYHRFCLEKGRCDTAKYAEDVNGSLLCGGSDWRLPSVEELHSLVDYSRERWVIDENYFEHSDFPVYLVWAATPNQDHIQPNEAYVLNVVDGAIGLREKGAYPPPHVWLVRENVSSFIVTAVAGFGGTVAPDSRIVAPNATAQFTVKANSGHLRNNSVGGTCPKGSWSGDTWTTGAISDSCTVSFGFRATVRFTDIPSNHWAWQHIYAIADAGITTGCGGGNYCPLNLVTRSEMAAFLLRGIHGGGYAPPTPKGTAFSDVPKSYWAASWIEQLAKEGVTKGCGGNRYCPENSVTRAEMAVFLLRSKYGNLYEPPVTNGTSFKDVPKSHWAASWIEKLAGDGVTTGCGNGSYCPDDRVTRAEMAVFLARTFGLVLPPKP